MSDSAKAINVFSNSTSSSRLSPLARPFTVNNRQESFDPFLSSSSSSSSSSTSSTSRLDQPFSYLSLRGEGHLHGYYANPSDATSIAALPCVDPDFQPNSRFAYDPLEEPPLDDYFSLPTHQFSQTSFIPGSASLGNVGHNIGVRGTAVDQEGSEILRNFDQSGSAGSLSCNNLLEKGTNVEGSKLFRDTYSVLHGKGIKVGGKDNRIRPEGKEKIHTESRILPVAKSELNLSNNCVEKPFCTSTALSFSPRPQDTQNQLSYSSPLMTWSHCDPTVIPNERCPPQLGSCGAETLVSHALEYFSSSAQLFQASGASSNSLIANPVPLENVASIGSDAVSNRNSYCGNVLPSMIDTYMVQNPVDKVAFHDQVTIEKGDHRKIGEPVDDETKYPSIRTKSKLQVACPNVSKDLSGEKHGSKAGIPDYKSSSNHEDSDVDSPCWEGTRAYKSPFRDSVAVNSEDSRGQSPSIVPVPLKSEHSKNETVKRNSLNPLAPVFIPGSSKQKVDYYQKECHGDSSLSSQKIAPLSVTSSSTEDKLTESVKTDVCSSERINDLEIQCSSDGHNSKKEYCVSYKPFRSSTVNSSCCFEPHLGEGLITSESQLVSGIKVAGSLECIAATTHNGLDRVEDIAHNGSNISFSLLTTKEIAMNSQSIGVDAFSDFTKRLPKPMKSMPPEMDVKLLINTIQYLSELLLQNSSFDLGSLSEHENDKLLNIINNLHVLRSKAGHMATRPDSSRQCTLYGRGQPADRYEVIEKDPKVIHSMEKEMPAEALFYRNLWLEAKAALHSMGVSNAC